jgi:hypothetical protein
MPAIRPPSNPAGAIIGSETGRLDWGGSETVVRKQSDCFNGCDRCIALAALLRPATLSSNARPALALWSASNTSSSLSRPKCVAPASWNLPGRVPATLKSARVKVVQKDVGEFKVGRCTIVGSALPSACQADTGSSSSRHRMSSSAQHLHDPRRGCAGVPCGRGVCHW